MNEIVIGQEVGECAVSYIPPSFSRFPLGFVEQGLKDDWSGNGSYQLVLERQDGTRRNLFQVASLLSFVLNE